jgi:hypothetical protein
MHFCRNSEPSNPFAVKLLSENQGRGWSSSPQLGRGVEGLPVAPKLRLLGRRKRLPARPPMRTANAYLLSLWTILRKELQLILTGPRGSAV